MHPQSLSISTGSFYPASTNKSIKRAHDLGFERIEIMIQDRELDYNFQRHADLTFFTKLKRIVQEYGLTVGSLHAPLLSTEQVFSTRTRSEILHNSLEVASIFEADTVVIHPHHFFMSYEAAYKFLTSSNGTIGDFILPNFWAELDEAEKENVCLAVENVAYWSDFPLLNDAKLMKRVLAALGDTRLGVDLDVLHSELGDCTFDFLTQFPESIVCLHLRDYRDDQTRVVPGKGKIDWRKIIFAARNMPRLRHFVMELAGRLEDSEIQKSANYMRELLNM